MENKNSLENKEGMSVRYTAEFVQDVQALLSKFPPRHEIVFGHHSTIEFKPANLDEIDVGKKSALKIIGRAYDSKGDVLLVENIKSKKKYPHITVSCAEGVPPMYSDELLESSITNGAIEYFDEPIEVEVVEGYSDGKNDILS